jgi:methylmalonyl-CoA mutase N-terminal domain/subunit
MEAEASPEILKVDSSVESKQIKNLNAVKAHRDALLVQKSLAKIKAAAATEENLMPLIYEAVKAYASVGEIMGTLRGVWGEYHDPGIV